MAKKNDEIREIENELQKEDYESVKDKISDIKGFEKEFKDAAKEMVDQAKEFYIALVEETLSKLGYNAYTVKNVYRKSYIQKSTNSFLEIFFTADDRLLLIGSIVISGQKLKVSVASSVYDKPREHIIAFE